MTNFADGPVAIVCGCLHNDGNTARAVTLKRDLLVGRAFQFTRAALDRPLNVVLRHVFRLGSSNGATQARIAIWISTAGPGSHGNFLDQPRKNLSAFGVGRALL